MANERECNSCRSNSGLLAACILATVAASGLSVWGEIYKVSYEPQKQLKGHFLSELAKVTDSIAKLVC